MRGGYVSHDRHDVIAHVHGSTKRRLVEPNWLHNDFSCTYNAYFLSVGEQSTVAPLCWLRIM